MNRFRQIFPHFLSSQLHSYSQIFFSNNKTFALLLILVTFFDFWAGVSGLIAVSVTNILAYIIGFNRNNIKAGYYGFNSLLVALGLGVYYNPSVEFFVILGFASLFTLLITVMFEGVIGKYGLPYLSIPFLIAIWMVSLATRHFEMLQISERGIYTYNELFLMGGMGLVQLYDWLNNLNLHDSIIIYFRSLGAIFFQYHLVPGIIVAIGLLIWSRIGFLLSLFGFYSAYYYYHFIGANFAELSYGYIGFNFILTAIAIGGFFVVSSRYSFLWVILVTPLISITITSSTTVLNLFQLSIFSLPFNFIVLMFLFVMKFRERYYLHPELVLYQQFSPEKNLYAQINNKIRFRNAAYLPISLPFFGEWTITQGHNGKHTHKEDWKHAWDFEICDETGLSFTGTGKKNEDFYCFNKPVLAPADGWIIEAIDYVEDNEINEVNLEQNWGNTIIIKHLDGLYSKLCHLKKYSIKVVRNDYVHRGDVIAYCGNSGRSPVPHIHFQIQATPHIGSKTLDYPLGNYIIREGINYNFHSYEKPKDKEIVSNILKNNSLNKAFTFIPGQKITFEIIEPIKKQGLRFSWEIMTDVYNNSFIYCPITDSKAYFKNDGNVHFFTHFEGDQHSLLFIFYLATYKVLNGFYQGMDVTDTMPPGELGNNLLMILQDFISPFYIFIRNEYHLYYSRLDDALGVNLVTLKSKVEVKLANWVTRKIEFEIKIRKNRFEGFSILEKNKRIEVKEVAVNE